MHLAGRLRSPSIRGARRLSLSWHRPTLPPREPGAVLSAPVGRVKTKKPRSPVSVRPSAYFLSSIAARPLWRTKIQSHGKKRETEAPTAGRTHEQVNRRMAWQRPEPGAVQHIERPIAQDIWLLVEEAAQGIGHIWRFCGSILARGKGFNRCERGICALASSRGY